MTGSDQLCISSRIQDRRGTHSSKFGDEIEYLKRKFDSPPVLISWRQIQKKKGSLTHHYEVVLLFKGQIFRVSNGFEKAIQSLEVTSSLCITCCRDDSNICVSAHEV